MKIFPTQTIVVSSGSAEVPWGPDFGEGANDNTWNAGVSLDLENLALENTKIVGIQFTMPSLALENSKSIGAHLSGTALGAPFWQAVETQAATANAASIVINVPTGTVDGDLLIAFVAAAAAVVNPDISTPAGWTSLAPQGGTNHNARVFWKIASSEPASYTFNFTATAIVSAGEIHRIIGVDPTTPINTSAGTNGSAADPIAPSVTTTAVNCLVMAFTSHLHTLAATNTPPASNTERTDFESVNVSRLGSSTATRVFAATGSTGTATFNCSHVAAVEYLSHRVAIAPGTITLAS